MAIFASLEVQRLEIFYFFYSTTTRVVKLGFSPLVCLNPPLCQIPKALVFPPYHIDFKLNNFERSLWRQPVVGSQLGSYSWKPFEKQREAPLKHLESFPQRSEPKAAHLNSSGRFQAGGRWQCVCGRLTSIHPSIITPSLPPAPPSPSHSLTNRTSKQKVFLIAPNQVSILQTSQWEQLLRCHINPCCLCKCTPFRKVLQKYDAIYPANHCLYNYACACSGWVLMNDIWMKSRITFSHMNKLCCLCGGDKGLKDEFNETDFYVFNKLNIKATTF